MWRGEGASCPLEKPHCCRVKDRHTCRGPRSGRGTCESVMTGKSPRPQGQAPCPISILKSAFLSLFLICVTWCSCPGGWGEGWGEIHRNWVTQLTCTAPRLHLLGLCSLSSPRKLLREVPLLWPLYSRAHRTTQAESAAAFPQLVSAGGGGGLSPAAWLHQCLQPATHGTTCVCPAVAAAREAEWYTRTLLDFIS